MFLTNVFNALTYAWNIWNDYVAFLYGFIKNIGKKHGVAVYFKGGRTLKNIL